MNQTIKQYIYLLLAVIFMAIAVNTVIIPYSIVSGGISGLSAIVEALTSISAPVFVFVANLILIILAYILISPKYALNSILGANILFPLALAIIPVGPVSDDVLLSSIFAGLFVGFGIYFLSMSNGSTGGTAILGKIVQKYTGLTYALSVSSCDIIIVGAGLFIFGIENTMYAVICIIVTTFTANYTEQGAQKTSVFHIITDNPNQMKQAIIEDIGRGVTVVPAEGGFNGDDRTILICVAKNSDIIRLKSLIAKTDKDTFYYITSASSTYGEGFGFFESNIS